MRTADASHRVATGRVGTGNRWSVLFNNVRIGTTTTAESARLDIESYAGVAVLLDIDSAAVGAHTLRLYPQHSPDGQAPWYDFEEGFWSALYWEDTATASGVHKSLILPNPGFDWVRFRLVGTGTDQSNYFDVTLRARPFVGPAPVPHA